MRKKIFSLILFLSLFLLFPKNSYAINFNIDSKLNRGIPFADKQSNLCPFGGQTGNIRLEFTAFNTPITCNTQFCGVEFYYNANTTASVNSTGLIFDTLAVTGLVVVDNFGVPCSVSGNSVSCLINNGQTLNSLSLYFPASQESNYNYCITSNLIGMMRIYDITDSVAGAINNTTNAVNSVNDSINNDSVSSDNDNSSTASGWASKNASDNVVADMVLMPITFLNAFNNGFKGSCSSYNLGSLFGHNINLPCINIANFLGQGLWSIIDILMSGFLILGIGKKFVRVFNDFTNLKDSQVDELYGGGGN